MSAANRNQAIETMCHTTAFRDGRWVTVWSDGTVLPVVRGGFDGEGAGGGAGDDAAAQAAAAAAATAAAEAEAAAQAAADNVKFTPEQQAVFDRKVQERVAATKTATARETAEALAKELGVSVDEAKATIAAEKKRKNDEADEKTKREVAEAERDAAKNSEKAIARDAKIRIAVADATAGLTDAEKDDAKRAKIRSDIAVLVGNELGADKLEPSDDEVSTALKAVQALHAGMFAAKKGTSGDPGGGPNGNGGSTTGMDAGRARAKAENEREAKQPAFLGGLTPLGGERVSA